MAAPGRKRDELEHRIIREFSSRARRNGLRAVVMAELARDLQISTKTLYRLFPTKAHLVLRMMVLWAARFDRDLDAVGQADGTAEDETLPFATQLVATSRVWQLSRRRFGNTFWDELERDYPDAYALFTAAQSRLRERLLDRLGPHMADGVDAPFAIELFDATLARALTPKVLVRNGLDARAAIGQAVRIWASGAVVPPLRSPPS